MSDSPALTPSGRGGPNELLPDGQLTERRAVEAFLGGWIQEQVETWLRRGVIASFAAGFSIPYFKLFNEVRVEGDELLESLPRRNVIFLANHQTYFLEAIAFFDLVYVRHRMGLEDPLLRFSAAEETMKMSPLTWLMRLAGGVTLRRSFREGGKDVKRPVDLEGVGRIREAIGAGWLLHFPAGTTRAGAPLRPGVAQLLHETRATAVPVRVDGFRRLLLLRQLPGQMFHECSIRLHPPLDLDDYYAAPYTREAGAGLLAQLQALIGDPPAA